MTSPRYVAVVGPGDEATDADRAAARDVGRLLAERGVVVLTGGLGGVMAAALEGAADAGGVSVALQPGHEREPCAASVVLPTGLGELRNALLVRCADAVIAIGGSWGTLSEIALARRTGKPAVCLYGWQVLDESGARVAQVVAESPRDAVEAVVRALPRDG